MTLEQPNPSWLTLRSSAGMKTDRMAKETAPALPVSRPADGAAG
jgi:hypothetical protein